MPLNRTVNEFGLSQPADILNKTRDLVIKTFAKSGENVKDGMDISLCAFSKKENKLYFAGAYNPLWIVRANEHLKEDQLQAKSTVQGAEESLIEYPATKQPVGYLEQMADFDQVEIQIFAGDQFYLFTDGYADQFGGEKGKKLKYRKFKNILLDNSQKEASQQNSFLTSFMEEWKDDLEQVDDICVIGLRPKNE